MLIILIRCKVSNGSEKPAIKQNKKFKNYIFDQSTKYCLQALSSTYLCCKIPCQSTKFREFCIKFYVFSSLNVVHEKLLFRYYSQNYPYGSYERSYLCFTPMPDTIHVQLLCTKLFMFNSYARNYLCSSPMHEIIYVLLLCPTLSMFNSYARNYPCPPPMHEIIPVHLLCTKLSLSTSYARNYLCSTPMHENVRVSVGARHPFYCNIKLLVLSWILVKEDIKFREEERMSYKHVGRTPRCCLANIKRLNNKFNIFVH